MCTIWKYKQVNIYRCMNMQLSSVFAGTDKCRVSFNNSIMQMILLFWRIGNILLYPRPTILLKSFRRANNNSSSSSWKWQQKWTNICAMDKYSEFSNWYYPVISVYLNRRCGWISVAFLPNFHLFIEAMIYHDHIYSLIIAYAPKAILRWFVDFCSCVTIVHSKAFSIFRIVKWFWILEFFL